MATPSRYETAEGVRWEIRFRTPDHKQTRKRGFKTKKAAQDYADASAVSMQQGAYVPISAGKKTVEALGPAWLERKQHLKPSAYRVLESTWRNYVLPKWGSRGIATILKTEVQAWVTNLAVGKEPGHPARSATVVKRAHGILHGILADAVSDRMLASNPASDVSMPLRKPKEKVYLSHEQVHAIAEAAKYPAVVRVLAYCGLRWGEMAALRVQDLDLERRRLRVVNNAVDVAGKMILGTPKTHRTRSVPFPRFMLDELRAAAEGKESAELLFPGPDGGYLRNARVHENNLSWFASAIKKAGAPRVTPHDLRHSAASFAVSAGANVKVVQRMLGHKTAAMTLDVYADLFEDDLDVVSDALDAAVEASRNQA
ncbi:tyrosine-type recombinase/integrase [Galactobacter valiniphilus]|uniref:tyrosine-type recombinase/integrase n=1 Tax=Galactobacter valiniphilus TaxID=2676122 RepID=UPI003736AA4B